MPRRSDIRRAASPVLVDARLEEAAWRNAPPLGEFHVAWWNTGPKEPTTVRMLWDDENLYVGYYCHDRHISA